MDGNLAQQTPAQIKRRLRAIHWKHPPKTRWPEAIERAIARIDHAAGNPHGLEYAAIFDAAPVAGRKRRCRRKRSDGGINTCSMLSAAIGNADLGNGLVALPVGGKWDRQTWQDLGRKAFGKTVEGAVSKRRFERCARELVALGFITIQQWRVRREDGGIRSEAGVKHITDKCWKALGVYGLVKRERMKRDRARKEEKRNRCAGMIPKTGEQRRRSAAKPMANPLRRVEQYVKPPHDPPPKSADEAAQLTFAELSARFGLTKAG